MSPGGPASVSLSSVWHAKERCGRCSWCVHTARSPASALPEGASGGRQSEAERLRSALAAAEARADEAEGALAGAQAEVETATRDLQARSALHSS